MLTKQTREKIAERLKHSKYELYPSDIALLFTGDNTKDDEEVFYTILDLCDTADMVELPRDKDGKVIHIGDTVWCSGKKETVKAIEIRKTAVYIHFIAPIGCTSFSSPELIAHAAPIRDHESIARAIEDIIYCLDDAAASLRLQDIAMELRKLGESDD